MTLEQFVSQYGYPAIFVGTFLEGETILILAGFLAHQGYLDLPLVVGAAFLGTLFGDQFYFYLGRFKGVAFLESRPRWKSRADRVFDYLRRHRVPLIIGFRFLYGLRTVTPFVLGASGISALSYLVLNGIGAGLWATGIGTMGYVLGSTLESQLDRIKHYEMWILASIAVFGACVWMTRWFIEKRR